MARLGSAIQATKIGAKAIGIQRRETLSRRMVANHGHLKGDDLLSSPDRMVCGQGPYDSP